MNRYNYATEWAYWMDKLIYAKKWYSEYPTKRWAKRILKCKMKLTDIED